MTIFFEGACFTATFVNGLTYPNPSPIPYVPGIDPIAMPQIGLKSTSTIVAIAIVLLACALPARSQRNGEWLLFRDITLTPGFDPDPTILRGVSGGEATAAEIAADSHTSTGLCRGFFNPNPDHKLQLSGPFPSLRLFVIGAGDTTLIVRGPGGTWCNDDYNGIDPGIAGQWLAGTYEIWIGSHHQGEYHPYAIELSEIELPEPPLRPSGAVEQY